MKCANVCVEKRSFVEQITKRSSIGGHNGLIIYTRFNCQNTCQYQTHNIYAAIIEITKSGNRFRLKQRDIFWQICGELKRQLEKRRVSHVVNKTNDAFIISRNRLFILIATN